MPDTSPYLVILFQIFTKYPHLHEYWRNWHSLEKYSIKEAPHGWIGINYPPRILIRFMAFQKVDQLDFQISLTPWHGQSFPDWSFWALIKWVLWLLSNSISSKIHARISLFSFPQTTNQIKGTKFAAKYRFSTTNSFPHVYFGLFLSTMRVCSIFWVLPLFFGTFLNS